MEVERNESSKARLHTEAGEATRLHAELSRVQAELSRSQNDLSRVQADLSRTTAESERTREKYEAGQQDIVRLKMAIEKSEGELQVLKKSWNNPFELKKSSKKKKILINPWKFQKFPKNA